MSSVPSAVRWRNGPSVTRSRRVRRRPLAARSAGSRGLRWPWNSRRGFPRGRARSSDSRTAQISPSRTCTHSWQNTSHGRPSPIHVQRAVEAPPVAGCEGCGEWTRYGPFGRVRGEHLRAPACAVGLEAREEVVDAPVDVRFGRPEVRRGPEAGLRPEGRQRSLPVLQVRPGVHVEAGARSLPAIRIGGAEQAVGFCGCHRQHEGIADLDVAVRRHGTVLSVAGKPARPGIGRLLRGSPYRDRYAAGTRRRPDAPMSIVP